MVKNEKGSFNSDASLAGHYPSNVRVARAILTKHFGECAAFPIAWIELLR